MLGGNRPCRRQQIVNHRRHASNVSTERPQPRLLLTKRDAAGSLGMSLRHFERMVQPGIPFVRSGQLTLYRPQDLERWAERHTTIKQAPPKAGQIGRRPIEQATGWPCLVVRHKVACPANTGHSCSCEPGYVARVWDPRRRRPVSSPTFRSPSPAIAWQEQTRAALKHGAATPGRPIKLKDASDRFLAAVRNGTALNKKGKPYKKSTINTLEHALKGRIEQELGALRLDEVRRGHIQMLVDEMVGEKLSGSRVRNVLNALRSLYTYAIARDLAEEFPANHILLPALSETPRDRIATPLEFQELLLALSAPDTVPFALAAYSTARSQEILNLKWTEIDWTSKTIFLAAEEEYAKTAAAKRAFPLIPQLQQILRDEWERQGKPTAGQLVCPARRPGRPPDSQLSVTALYARADHAWDAKKLAHIRLHESRHTAASWMRAAGIDLKTRSVLMGHASTASTDRGHGSITEDRYTHLLPGEIEQAGEQFATYLTTQLRRN
jgi:integrase